MLEVDVWNIWHARRTMAPSCMPGKRWHTLTVRGRHASKHTRAALSTEEEYTMSEKPIAHTEWM